MEKIRKVMIDLETLDRVSNSAILSIAAVDFDDSENFFYSKINLDSCLEHKLSVSKSTLVWWLNNDLEIFKDQLKGEESLKDVLNSLSNFIYKKFDQVWCYGASFDFPILKNAYNVCNLEIPWKYSQEHDLRTLVNLFSESKGYFKNNHNPVQDSINQIEAYKQIYDNFMKFSITKPFMEVKICC